jgi:hypothetical protein
MINPIKNQSNKEVIEKYCYQNDPANCSKYGGLYKWNEALQYDSGMGKIKGICPSDWHLSDTVDAFDLYLNHGSGIIYLSDSQLEYGFSVRCIKD